MGVKEARRKIALNEPHIVNATGNPITFSTNIIAPLSLIGGNSIFHCGKNLLNTSADHIAFGYYTSNGNISADLYEICCLDYIRVVPNTSVTISSKINGTFICMMYDVNKNVLYRLITERILFAETFYMNRSNVAYIRVNYCPKPNRKHNSLNEFSSYELQVEYGDSASVFEPHIIVSNEKTIKGINNCWDNTANNMEASYWTY